MNHGVGNRARPRTAGDGAGHGLLANHRRTPPQIGSVTLALAPEPSGCDTRRRKSSERRTPRLPATRRPISPMSWTLQPGSQKRRRWTFHSRLFRRAVRASAYDKVSKKIGVIRGAWTDAVSKGGMSGTDAGNNRSGNRSGNWTQKMGNP